MKKYLSEIKWAIPIMIPIYLVNICIDKFFFHHEIRQIEDITLAVVIPITIATIIYIYDGWEEGKR